MKQSRRVTKTELAAISKFFNAVDDLKKRKIIRSDKYLGDIAEFLCVRYLGLSLSSSLRQIGHDGMLGRKKTQVKYHGGTSTTVDCGDPSKYHCLLVVLGPSSILRPEKIEDPYLIYQVSSHAIRKKIVHADGKWRLGKRDLTSALLVVPVVA
jgi:hypothetical protein